MKVSDAVWHDNEKDKTNNSNKTRFSAMFVTTNPTLIRQGLKQRDIPVINPLSHDRLLFMILSK
jgi:acetylglutamate kinase